MPNFDVGNVEVSEAGEIRIRDQPSAPNGGTSNFDVPIIMIAGAHRVKFILKVTVTDDVDYGMVLVARGFVRPAYATAFPDESGRLLVMEEGGRVALWSPELPLGAVAPTFLDLRPEFQTNKSGKLKGLAISPNFMQDRKIYLVVETAGLVQIRSYRTPPGNPPVADPATVDIIMSQHQDAGFGWMDFGPDGLLYIATENEFTGLGGNSDPYRLDGKILRVDVHQDAFPDDSMRDYAIPQTNPYADGGGAPEVWVRGMNRPYCASFERETGYLWIGDGESGQEINIARSIDGGQTFDSRSRPGDIQPVLTYTGAVGKRAGNNVVGGYVYRGPLSHFKGAYFFADQERGSIRLLQRNRVVLGTTLSMHVMYFPNTAFNPYGGFDNPEILSLAEDYQGNLFSLRANGEMLQLKQID